MICTLRKPFLLVQLSWILSEGQYWTGVELVPLKGFFRTCHPVAYESRKLNGAERVVVDQQMSQFCIITVANDIETS